MIGTGSIGEWAIGEDDLDNPSSANEVLPDASFARASIYAPVVTSGASVSPETASAEASQDEPAIAAGASIGAPTAEAQASSEMDVKAGASSHLPALASSATPYVPRSTAGASAYPPLSTAEANLFDPSSEVGSVVISPISVQSFVISPGGIGSAIGEFGIGEGDEEAQTIIGVVRAYAIAVNPRISAGATAAPPSSDCEAEALNPEIDARERDVRFYAIAS